MNGLSLYDAHNHLQDERLRPQIESILADLARENVAKPFDLGGR
jgi:Tat protein secretion system quality control protein TatD with DNase activity